MFHWWLPQILCTTKILSLEEKYSDLLRLQRHSWNVSVRLMHKRFNPDEGSDLGLLKCDRCFQVNVTVTTACSVASQVTSSCIPLAQQQISVTVIHRRIDTIFKISEVHLCWTGRWGTVHVLCFRYKFAMKLDFVRFDWYPCNQQPNLGWCDFTTLSFRNWLSKRTTLTPQLSYCKIPWLWWARKARAPQQVLQG